MTLLKGTPVALHQQSAENGETHLLRQPLLQHFGEDHLPLSQGTRSSFNSELHNKTILPCVINKKSKPRESVNDFNKSKITTQYFLKYQVIEKGLFHILKWYGSFRVSKDRCLIFLGRLF